MVELHKEDNQIDNKEARKWIISIPVAIGILIIGIFIFYGQNRVVFKKVTGTPEEIVNAAIANTAIKSLEEQAKMSHKMGQTQLRKIREGEASEMYFNLEVQDTSGLEEMDIEEGAGLAGMLQRTKHSNKLNGKFSLLRENKEFFGVSIYKDDNELGVYTPQFLDTPYAVFLDSFLEDYHNSVLYQIIGKQDISQTEIDKIEKGFNLFKQYMEGDINLFSDKEYMNQAKAIEKEFIKELELHEAGKEEITLQDGSVLECKVYSGTATGKVFSEFISEEVDLFMNLEFVKDYLAIVGQQLEYIAEDISLPDTASISMEFLVDDTYLRGITLGVYNNNEYRGDITIKFLGNDYILDHVIMNMDSDDDRSNIELAFEQNLGEKSDLVKRNISANVASIVKIDYGYSYNTRAKADNFNINYGVEASEGNKIHYTAMGTKTVNKKDISTHLSKASFNFETNQEESSMDFILEYGIKAIKANDIQIDKTDVKYLFDLSTIEIINAAKAIEAKGQSFMASNQSYM